MDHQTFNVYLEEKFDHIRSVLGTKAAEYVPNEGGSRFHNFDVAAAFNNESPEKALWGMLTKHLVSIADMVKDDPTDHSMAVWDEKIGDALNYLLLLNGMVKDHHETKNLVQFHSGLVNAVLPPGTNVIDTHLRLEKDGSVTKLAGHLSGLASGGMEQPRTDGPERVKFCRNNH
ncbi:gp064 [Rhodococcus phage ReqiPoco6]|uniref:Gp064 n=1 Tax=Rhodococcus phage ReqiPoco6 TaxID=691964 RepID=D4P7T2_9CAUD|nr:gp064 [Rhodococcus phage ReqiPoco6]ADD81062.1 gp064 [Rhodococcus phage ReqiPoco6]